MQIIQLAVIALLNFSSLANAWEPACRNPPAECQLGVPRSTCYAVSNA
ncbi:hypothetical protein Vi05172_g8627 [Venturia inaequalis]|nr:hypothetical protein Vi05172_g8627 [Venturia inaequalis]